MTRRTYYDLIRERITRAASEAAVAANTMDHAALAGSIREITLRNCIEPYLTHSFRCGSGKIVDTRGLLTKQIDLIVYQTKLAPPLMVSKEVGIFPAECCSYVFEVKSTLTATEIKSAVEVATSVRNLKRFPKTDGKGNVSYQQSGPATILFAFGSDIAGHELERYLKYDLEPDPAFVGLVVLGKGYWYWTKDKGWFGATAGEFGDPEGIFALFIAGFTNTLAAQETTIRAFTPGNYILPYDIEAKPFTRLDAHPVTASGIGEDSKAGNIEDYRVEGFAPAKLTTIEIEACLVLIEKGDAVNLKSAKRELPRATVLIVAYKGTQIVGTGAIKRVRLGYAAKIASQSGVTFPPDTPELGYVAVDLAHRGHGLSRRIVEVLLSKHKGQLFATTGNEYMEKTLGRAGFIKKGKKWKHDVLSFWNKE